MSMAVTMDITAPNRWGDCGSEAPHPLVYAQHLTPPPLLLICHAEGSERGREVTESEGQQVGEGGRRQEDGEGGSLREGGEGPKDSTGVYRTMGTGSLRQREVRWKG